MLRNWNVREFRAQVNVPSTIPQVQGPIQQELTLIRGLLNPIKEVVLLISNMRSYSPYHAHLHPPSLSFLSTPLASSQEPTVKSSLAISPCHNHEWTLSAAYTKCSTHQVQHTRIAAYTECSIHWVQHTPSAAYTEYSIYWVQHTSSIAYIEHSIHLRLLSLHSHNYEWTPQCSFASGVPPHRLAAISQFSIRVSKVKSPCYIPTVWSLLTNKWSLRTCRASHWPLPDRPPPTIPPITLDHSLQVHLQTHLITASKCISKLVRSQPPSSSTKSLDHVLQVHLGLHLISASQCISKLTPSRPPIASEFTQSQSPVESSNWIDYGPGVYIWAHLILASKCTSNLAQLEPLSVSLSALDLSLQVHHRTRTITASKSISEHARSWTQSESLSSLDRHLQAHLELISSTACIQSRYTVCRWVALSIHWYIEQNTNWIQKFQQPLNNMQ